MEIYILTVAVAVFAVYAVMSQRRAKDAEFKLMEAKYNHNTEIELLTVLSEGLENTRDIAIANSDLADKNLAAIRLSSVEKIRAESEKIHLAYREYALNSDEKHKVELNKSREEMQCLKDSTKDTVTAAKELAAKAVADAEVNAYKSVEEKYNALSDKYKIATEDLIAAHAAATTLNQERHEGSIKLLKDSHADNLKSKMEMSRKQTRSVNFGFASERVAPLLASDFDIKDIRYFGEVMDFMVFDGLTSGEEVSIVFVDVKSSGKVQEILDNKDKWEKTKKYNPITALVPGKDSRQRRVIKAVQEGRVSFEIWMCDEVGNFESYSVSQDKKCKLL